MKSKKTSFIILLITASLLAACGSQSTPTPSTEIQATQLVQTLDAISTISAGKTAVAQLTQIAQSASPTPISLLPTATFVSSLPTATSTANHL
jgi:hypothetical protein